MNKVFFALLLFLSISCQDKEKSSDATKEKAQDSTKTNPFLVLLGTAQDAGFPQIACTEESCEMAFRKESPAQKVIALGLVDVPNKKTYLFEATPDMVRQTKQLTALESQSAQQMVDGIFLTHAHMGHYTGLMYLGKESINADNIPVFVMPRMKEYLTNNGPWSQLVSQQNISLEEMENEQTISISEDIKITPFKVPHRDEYSETVGYKIKGPDKTALFIPDIDKWKKWDKDIIEEIKKVDYAFLDATFFSGAEMDNRDISQIPHPLVVESLELFKELDSKEKSKVIFIHLNHTNPLWNLNSKEAKRVLEAGFKIGQENDRFKL